MYVRTYDTWSHNGALEFAWKINLKYFQSSICVQPEPSSTTKCIYHLLFAPVYNFIKKTVDFLLNLSACICSSVRLSHAVTKRKLWAMKTDASCTCVYFPGSRREKRRFTELSWSTGKSQRGCGVSWNKEFVKERHNETWNPTDILLSTLLVRKTFQINDTCIWTSGRRHIFSLIRP